MICITMYNEGSDLLTESMSGVLENVRTFFDYGVSNQ